jgi:hypothetical protein
VWYLVEVGKCDSRRMVVLSLHVDCNSAGFEKRELAHVIRQCSISGSQVLQKVVVLRQLIRLDVCRRRIFIGCSIKVVIAAATNGSFDYFSVGVWDSGVITIAR